VGCRLIGITCPFFGNNEQMAVEVFINKHRFLKQNKYLLIKMTQSLVIIYEQKIKVKVTPGGRHILQK
ncbi:MAG: hypothetical protein ABIN25_05840, partial [Ginsengibacter sp.]